jgi:HAD superfamily hydrolase (TIGR01459 family)
MSQPLPAFISGMSSLVGRYRGMLIDLWGVLHDGKAALPGAIAALHALRSAGVRVCLLSNAPRRVADVAARLDMMGITSACYDHLITSGEAAWEALNDPADARHGALGRRYLHIAPTELAGLLSHTARIAVDAPEEADFVVATGFDPSRSDAMLRDILAACAARRLPMICTNPDLHVHIADSLIPCAGTLAHWYQDLGGSVLYHGKPHAPIYRRALELLSVAPDEVLGVGDSLRTDVVGARLAGLDAMLIAAGVHRDELGIVNGGDLNRGRLAELLARHQAQPTFVAARFRW